MTTVSKSALHCFPSTYALHSFASPTRDAKTLGVVWGLVSRSTASGLPTPKASARFPELALTVETVGDFDNLSVRVQLDRSDSRSGVAIETSDLQTAAADWLGPSRVDLRSIS